MDSADPEVAVVEALADAPRHEWFPMVAPVVAYTSTDGWGAGLGGQVYSRPAAWDTGYRWQLSGGLWATTGFRYQSHQVQLDWRGDRDRYVGKIGYRWWTDMQYAGQGGADVIVDWGDAESGNHLVGPYAFLGVARTIDGSVFAPYIQGYARDSRVDPRADGLLAERDPYGAEGGFYFDVTAGAEVLTVDRWPVPIHGWRAETGLAGGMSFTRAQGPGSPAEARPVGNLHAEVTRWQPLAGDRLVLGARGLVDHSLGARPFFEEDVMGGRWRDEIGSDQPLPGYGRTRTRGDGLITAMIELRSLIVQTRSHFWDVGVYGSLIAEEGYLFHGWDPGPHLPSLGGGPMFVWQHALQFRPFVAYGWRADVPDGPRRARPQFGVSFQDPL